jgi:trk system potassium uptake protein
MSFLRRLLDLPLLVILIGICAVSMLLPAGHAAALRQFEVARAFFYSGLILLILFGMIAIATATHRHQTTTQSLLAEVLGAYLVLPVIMAVPLHQAVPDLQFSDAWFEMLSCFTTTGATLFDTPGELARPIHFWRAFMGWLGGFFILSLAVAVLAPMGLGGAEIRRGQTTGRTLGGIGLGRHYDPPQRFARSVVQLFPPYAGITVILWVALLLAGDSALIALCHAMSTLSTSGISPLVGLNGTASGITGEVLIFAFLGFAITRNLAFQAENRSLSNPVWRDPELRLACVIVACVTVAIMWRQVAYGFDQDSNDALWGFLSGLWGILFTAVSFLTTTGFQSAYWPELGAPGLVVAGLAIFGGGVATTAGGVKLLRVYALLRHAERELERIVHPHSIGGHGPVARTLRRQGAYLAWIFFMIFGLSLAAIAAALTLTGLNFADALVLAIACLTTTGPLAATAGDTAISYAGLSVSAKGILGLAMVLGRLEILAVLALLAPKGWR